MSLAAVVDGTVLQGDAIVNGGRNGGRVEIFGRSHERTYFMINIDAATSAYFSKYFTIFERKIRVAEIC